MCVIPLYKFLFFLKVQDCIYFGSFTKILLHKKMSIHIIFYYNMQSKNWVAAINCSFYGSFQNFSLWAFFYKYAKLKLLKQFWSKLSASHWNIDDRGELNCPYSKSSSLQFGKPYVGKKPSHRLINDILCFWVWFSVDRLSNTQFLLVSTKWSFLPILTCQQNINFSQNWFYLKNFPYSMHVLQDLSTHAIWIFIKNVPSKNASIHHCNIQKFHISSTWVFETLSQIKKLELCFCLSV